VVRRSYRDLRAYLDELERCGKLVRIARAIDKDTEMHPLVRLQYRGLAEDQRRGFLFENVVDARGQHYDMSVAVGCMAGSRAIYAIGMGVADASQIGDRWVEAQAHLIPPIRVAHGAVHDRVYIGVDLERIGGLGYLPVPISTPGFDNAPYTSASHWLSRDPDSGQYNLGNYRGQIKAPTRLGCFAGSQTDMWHHWKKYRARGEPMPAALITGVPPNISYAAVARLPRDVDEYAMAGAIAGEPVELVRCKTLDLEVPAWAEVVVEGVIPTDVLELEGPFGEFPGYLAKSEVTAFMNVTAITHRTGAIFQGFVSQFPPGENSVISGTSRENIVLKLLRVDHGMDNVREVAAHESTGSGFGLLVIQVKDPRPGQAARILELLPFRVRGKITVVVDDDVDPRDADMVNWALAFRFQPARDAQLVPTPENALDPSIADPNDPLARSPIAAGETRASCLLIDATRKWPYPPTSLPAREYMERALELWRAEGLPELHIRRPLWGTELGYWPDERRAEAKLAVEGRYYETGTKFAQHRRQLHADDTLI
jgi:UbiD family decarboxylase